MLWRAHGLWAADRGEGLGSWLASRRTEAAAALERLAAGPPPLAITLPGQGQQHEDMGRDAFAVSRAFRRAVEELDAAVVRHGGASALGAGLFRGPKAPPGCAERLASDPRLAPSAIFTFQVAAIRALEELGVRASAVVGHSLGEVAAAYASGLLDEEQAAFCVATRAELQATLAGTGGMCALRCRDRAAADELLAAYPGAHVACVNGPGALTVGGEADVIERLCADHPRAAREVAVPCAFHTPLMDPIREAFEREMARLPPMSPGGAEAAAERRARTALYTSSAQPHRQDGDAPPSMDGPFWWRNLRGAVDFDGAVSALLADNPGSVVLEVSAANQLNSYVRKSAKARGLEEPVTLNIALKGAGTLKGVRDAAARFVRENAPLEEPLVCSVQQLAAYTVWIGAAASALEA